MKTYNSLEAAISFVNSLNIPESEIDFIEKLPHIFCPYDVRLKWADCDIIAIRPNWIGVNENRPDEPPYKQVFEVQKRKFGGPISCTEAIGMAPKRYKTPVF